MATRAKSKTRTSGKSAGRAVALRSSPPQNKRSITSLRLYRKLDDYQKDAVDFAMEVKTAAMIFEQGTGKTWIALGVVEAALHEDFCGLIVVPLANLESTWLATINSQLPQVTVCRSLDELATTTGPRILLIHYEALPPLINRVRKAWWDLIAYDESQRLKARASLASRTAAKLRDRAEYKLILTGTPLDHQTHEFWAQYRFLAPHLLGVRWKDFEDEFMEPVDIDLSKYRPGSMQWRRMMKAKQIREARRPFDMTKLPRFLELVGPVTMSVRSEDVLDLPGLTIERVPVKLSGEQSLIYEELEEDLITRLSQDSTVTASLRVTQIVKLRQVCGGYLIDDDGETYEVGRAKMRKLIPLVRSHDKPIVIFCCYSEEVIAIAEEMGRLVQRVATLTGKTKKKERPELIRQFQAGEIDVLVCQIKTGGVGVDLYRSAVAIVYSMPHSYIDFSQAIKRIHRRGQTNDCRVFLLVVGNTVDEDCYLAIQRKQKVTDVVLSRLRR